MKDIVDKLKIIGLKEQGYSNRKIARELGYDRKTVGRYWNSYKKEKEKLSEPEQDIRKVQEKMVEAPKYTSDNRKRRKLTDEILLRLEEILEEERKKDKLLGIHKQQKTKKQIHEQLVME